MEETAAFYDSALLWVKGPHDIMLDPVGGEAAAQAILDWVRLL